MGEGCSKQMARVCSIPVVAHTLIAFQQAEHIHEIVVAAKKDELPLYESMAKIYGITKFSTAVIGGKTRQESVENAFAKIKDRAKFVAIADGARCLITPDDIDRVCNAAYLYGAATAAQKGGGGGFFQLGICCQPFSPQIFSFSLKIEGSGPYR